MDPGADFLTYLLIFGGGMFVVYLLFKSSGFFEGGSGRSTEEMMQEDYDNMEREKRDSQEGIFEWFVNDLFGTHPKEDDDDK